MKICVAKEPEGIGAVKEEGDWEELELTVDSGATDTVIQPKTLPSIEITEGPAFKRGVEYEMANGEYAPNLGEKKFQGVTEEGSLRGLTAQVVEVSENLLRIIVQYYPLYRIANPAVQRIPAHLSSIGISQYFSRHSYNPTKGINATKAIILTTN